MWVHDGGVRCYGSSQDIVGVGKVDNHNLVLLVNLFADTNEVVALEGERLHGNEKGENGERHVAQQKSNNNEPGTRSTQAERRCWRAGDARRM